MHRQNWTRNSVNIASRPLGQCYVHMYIPIYDACWVDMTSLHLGKGHVPIHMWCRRSMEYGAHLHAPSMTNLAHEAKRASMCLTIHSTVIQFHCIVNRWWLSQYLFHARWIDASYLLRTCAVSADPQVLNLNPCAWYHDANWVYMFHPLCMLGGGMHVWLDPCNAHLLPISRWYCV